MNNLGMILLGIWLILGGASELLNFSLPAGRVVMAILAVSSGGVLLFHEVGNKFRNIGMSLLGLWLILKGAMVLFGLSFSYSHSIMAGLGVAAGIMLMIRR